MRGRRHDSRRARAAVVALACSALIGAVLVPLGSPGAVAANAAGPATQTGQTAPSSGDCPVSNPPNELLLTAGTPQTAELDGVFASALQVSLANTNGCPLGPVAGTPITFTAPLSGASATFAASGASTLTVGADSSGNAAAETLTANDSPGSYTIIAQSVYGSVSFSLTNTAAGIPATATAVSPTRQQAIAGSEYRHPLAVRVLDAGGQPVSGVTVTFTLRGAGAGGVSGGSNGSGGSSAGATFANGSSTTTAKTGSDGVASSPPFDANQSAGPFVALASVAHVSNPARFQLLNQPARGLRLTRIGSARRTATAGRPYRGRLRVRLRAVNGSPVIGATVSFTLGAAGGSSGGGSSGGPSAGASFTDATDTATVTTGRSGVAVSPAFSANTVAGSFTAIATSPATAGVARFTLTNLPGGGERLTRIGSARRTATVGQPYWSSLRARIQDAGGSPVIGATVTFAIAAGTSSGSGNGEPTSGSGSAGASFPGGSTQATETTNANGVAVSPRLTADTSAGTFTATATAGSGTATFQLANRPGPAASVVAGAAATEATTVGSPFLIPLGVTVTDAYGNRVPGALVTFTAPGAGASGAFNGRRDAIVPTNKHGIAVAPPLTANRAPGGYIVTATTGDARAAAFALVNQAP